MLQMEMDYVLVNRAGIFENYRPQFRLPPPLPQLLIFVARSPQGVQRIGPGWVCAGTPVQCGEFPSLQAASRRLHRFERLQWLRTEHSQRLRKGLAELD